MTELMMGDRKVEGQIETIEYIVEAVTMRALANNVTPEGAREFLAGLYLYENRPDPTWIRQITFLPIDGGKYKITIEVLRGKEAIVNFVMKHLRCHPAHEVVIQAGFGVDIMLACLKCEDALTIPKGSIP